MFVVKAYNMFWTWHLCINSVIHPFLSCRHHLSSRSFAGACHTAALHLPPIFFQFSDAVINGNERASTPNAGRTVHNCGAALVVKARRGQRESSESRRDDATTKEDPVREKTQTCTAVPMSSNLCLRFLKNLSFYLKIASLYSTFNNRYKPNTRDVKTGAD